MLAPLLTSAVQSCHTGSVSLPLLVTLTLYSASAGMLPVTASRATVMSPSTAMGVSRVMVAAWTALVKVAGKAAGSGPSFAPVGMVGWPRRISWNSGGALDAAEVEGGRLGRACLRGGGCGVDGLGEGGGEGSRLGAVVHLDGDGMLAVQDFLELCRRAGRLEGEGRPAGDAVTGFGGDPIQLLGDGQAVAVL